MARTLIIIWALLVAVITATSQRWERYPVFPPGYTRVCATETTPSGVIILDICGRTVDASTGKVLGYAYTESSVANTVRTRSGWLIQYFDGALFTGKSLVDQLQRIHSSIRQIVPDKHGGAFIAANNGMLYTFAGGNLNDLSVRPSVQTIVGLSDTSLLAFDSSGVMQKLEKEQNGRWIVRSSQGVKSHKDIHRCIGALTNDSVLVMKSNGAYCIYRVGMDSLHSDFDMRSIPDFKPYNTLSRVGMVGALTDSAGLVAFDVGTPIGCMSTPVACAVYSYATNTWTALSRDGDVDGRLTSAEIHGDTITYGTTNGSVVRVHPQGFQPIQKRRIRGDLTRWESTVRDSNYIFFCNSIVTCDTNRPEGFLVATWDIQDREWKRVVEVIPQSIQLEGGDALGPIYCDVSTKNNRMVIARFNAVIVLDPTTGYINNETKTQSAVIGLKYMRDKSLVVAGYADRFVLDTALRVVSRTAYVDDSIRFATSVIIDAYGSILYSGASNSIVLHNALQQKNTVCTSNNEFQNVDCAFRTVKDTFLLVGERDGRFTIRQIDRSDGRTLSSIQLSNPKPPSLALQRGIRSDGPDFVMPSLQQPSLVIVRHRDNNVAYIPPPKGWVGPTESRDRWTSGGLQHQLDDSTYLTIMSTAEMWVYTAQLQPTNIGCQQERALKLEVYPNPANSHIAVRAPSEALGLSNTVEMRLVDANGRSMFQQTISRSLIESTGTAIIDVADISNGLYLLVLQSAERTTSTPVMIHR